MTEQAEPVSLARLAGLALLVALSAAIAIVGLVLSDQEDDAERIAYVIALGASIATALLLIDSWHRRRAEIARLRAEAAVVVFQLRALQAELAGQPGGAGHLASTLRASAVVAARARLLAATLARAGVAQELIELRVALEALEYSLGSGSLAGRRG